MLIFSKQSRSREKNYIYWAPTPDCVLANIQVKYIIVPFITMVPWP